MRASNAPKEQLALRSFSKTHKAESGFANLFARSDASALAPPLLQPLPPQEPLNSVSPMLTKAELQSLSANTATCILQARKPSRELTRPLFNTLFQAYNARLAHTDLAHNERTEQFISKQGLTQTPEYDSQILPDPLHLSSYIRAIDKAIIALLGSGQETLFIAYPACGPLAPLLLPLLSHYQGQGITGQQLRITLINQHPEVIASLHRLLSELELQEYVQQMYCGDPCSYNAPMLFDLVILELMPLDSNCKKQFNIAHHFAQQLSTNGYLIPQQVDIYAVMQAAQASDAHVHTDLGVVLSLTAQKLRNLTQSKLKQEQPLCTHTLTLPILDKQSPQYMLELYPYISLFADEALGFNGTEETLPLADLKVYIDHIPSTIQTNMILANSGDTLTFYYDFGAAPGFRVSKSQSK